MPASVITVARGPLSTNLYQSKVIDGGTLAEIIATVPDLPDYYWDEGVCCINGHVIPRENWAVVRPRVHDRAISITMHLRLADAGGGGGGGGAQETEKSPFRTIATIGLIAATGFIGAGALGGAFGAGSIGASLLSGAVGIGGGALINMLFPAPTPDAPDQPAIVSNVPVNSAGIGGNILAKGGVLPRVFGTRRINPPIVRQVSTKLSNEGKDEEFEVVFALAGPHKLEDILVGGTSIELEDNLQVDIREGFPGDPQITLVTTQVVEEQINLELSKHKLDRNTTGDDQGGFGEQQRRLLTQSDPAASTPDWHRFTLKPDFDRVVLDLLLPEGLTNDVVNQIMGGITDTVPQEIPIRIRIREVGETTWINLPELHYVNSTSSQIRTTIRLFRGAASTGTTISQNANAGWKYAFRLTEPQGEISLFAGFGFAMSPPFPRWEAHSMFGSGETLADFLVDNGRVDLSVGSADIYLDPTAFPVGTYEFEIKRGYAFNGRGAIQTTEPIWRWGESPSKDGYVIEALNVETNRDGPRDLFQYDVSSDPGDSPFVVQSIQRGMRDTLVLQTMRSIWDEHPIAEGSNCALIALKGKNRRFDNLSVLASAYVDDFDGTDWRGPAITSNPATHYRELLISRFNERRLPVALLDEASLLDWWKFCEDEALTANLTATGQNIASLLKQLAGAGLATPRGSAKWGVSPDRDRSRWNPVQIFSPNNSANFQFTKVLPATLPDGFRVSFPDATKKYETSEIETFIDGVTSGTARFIEEIKYEAITDAVNADRRALFDLRQLHHRAQIYSLDTDSESIVCQRGDLVGVQHDVLDVHAGFSRVKAVITNEAVRVTAVELYSEVPVTTETGDFFSSSDVFSEPNVFALGKTSGIVFRLNDGFGSLLVKGISSATGNTTTITFLEPFSPPSGFEAGMLVVTGILGSEYRRLIVRDIKHSPNLRAKLSLHDEAADKFFP